MYDVIVVENGTVLSITIWQGVDYKRAVKLSQKLKNEHSEAPEWEWGIMASGKARLGQEVILRVEGETKIFAPREI